MNVLSLFDGISCGQLALKNLNKKVDYYLASEIDKYAINITQKNFPNTHQLGDVNNIDFSKLTRTIDLLMGGSPCQDLSNYKCWNGQNLGLKGDKSSLFYKFVEALRVIKPKYFLLENVASMKDEWRDIISKELGVDYIYIDSEIVSGASRPRYYWTNIPITGKLEETNEVLEDILEPVVDEKYFYNNNKFQLDSYAKRVVGLLDVNGHNEIKRVFNPKMKCSTLMCDGDGGNRVKKVLLGDRVRKLTPIEYERLQNLPDNYTAGVSNSRRYTAIGNGWTIKVIEHLLKNI